MTFQSLRRRSERATRGDGNDDRPIRPIAVLACRAALWLLLLLGAAGGLLGALRPPAEASNVGPVTSERRDAPAAALGFAEVTVHRWIEQSESGHPGSLDRLFVEAPDDIAPPRWQPRVNDATAVASEPVADSYWSVTVAADLVIGPPPGRAVRWFVEVGVIGDNVGRFLVAGTPAIVAEPAAADGRRRPVDTVMLTPSPDDPLAATVAGFFAALLTGDGQIDRYTAAGTVIAAIDPPPFAQVTLERLATRSTAQGTAVRASVRARTADGDERALAYQLLLTEHEGRWEVREPPRVACSAD